MNCNGVFWLRAIKLKFEDIKLLILSCWQLSRDIGWTSTFSYLLVVKFTKFKHIKTMKHDNLKSLPKYYHNYTILSSLSYTFSTPFPLGDVNEISNLKTRPAYFNVLKTDSAKLFFGQQHTDRSATIIIATRICSVLSCRCLLEKQASLILY